MPKTQKTERTLRCRLTPDEIREIAKGCAEAVNKRDQLKADKKRVSKDFDAQISAVEARISSDSEKVRSEYELRLVPCVEHYDMPRRGQKTVVRGDTGEPVEVLEMTDDEQVRADELV